MTIENLLEILEKNVAPVALSDEFCAKYKAYDNSGVIINCGNRLNGALFSLDLSAECVKKAEECGFNAIVTHHPAIYGGIEGLDLTKDPQAKALARCIEKGISVISMHLNFDAAEQGIDYFLMRGLGGESGKICLPLSRGGYGRVYSIKPVKFSQFIQSAAAEFSTRRITSYGDGEKTISTVASFCGAGCDDEAIAFAAENSADVFVSSDFKHHQITALAERGINVVNLTHYCAEAYGFKEICNKIKQITDIPTSFFTDARFM